jgi:hypothetical protein
MPTTRRFALLVAAAAISLPSVSFAVTAQARTTHKHHKHPAKKHPVPKKPSVPSGGYTLKGLATTIVPQSGVGAITLPSTLLPAQILSEFGQPPVTAADPKPITMVSGAIAAIDYTAASGAQQVSFTFDTVNGDVLNQVSVTSGAYKTASGVGVGSTQAQVQAAYPQAQCPPAQTDQCLISGNDASGNVIQTAFVLFDGKVDQVIITDSE